MPVYGAVPPVAETVMIEEPPLHKIAVADEDATSADGSATVIVVVAVHPFASVIV